MKLFNLRPELVTKVYEQIKQTPYAFKIDSKDKKSLFNEEKKLRNGMDCLEKERDILSQQIHLTQYDALKTMMFFPTEMKMLQLRQQYEDNPALLANLLGETILDNVKEPIKPELEYLKLNKDGTMGNNIFINQSDHVPFNYTQLFRKHINQKL